MSPIRQHTVQSKLHKLCVKSNLNSARPFDIASPVVGFFKTCVRQNTWSVHSSFWQFIPDGWTLAELGALCSPNVFQAFQIRGRKQGDECWLLPHTTPVPNRLFTATACKPRCLFTVCPKNPERIASGWASWTDTWVETQRCWKAQQIRQSGPGWQQLKCKWRAW